MYVVYMIHNLYDVCNRDGEDDDDVLLLLYGGRIL